MPGDDRYSTVAIALHWTIAILLIGQLAGGLYMVDLPKEEAPLKVQLFQLHKSFGVLILLLTMLRLIWRLTHKPPALPEAMAGWEKFAARATHIGFYILLIAIPLLGWAYVSAAPLRVPTVLFGVIPFPHMPFFEGLADRKEVAEIFEESHEIAAKLVILLLLLHVAAALKHQFVNRDDVLARMLPFIRKRR
ncbi:MAG: cytochrome b [Amphiplicatus sp.]